MLLVHVACLLLLYSSRHARVDATIFPGNGSEISQLNRSVIEQLQKSNAGYSPYWQENCPSELLSRAISPDEEFTLEGKYIHHRSRVAIEHFLLVLNKLGLKPEDAWKTHVQNKPPIFGIAFSGGGFRASLNAASMYYALDERAQITPGSGIFQSLSYMTGLSGGSWFVGAVSIHDFPTADKLVSNVWNYFQREPLSASQGLSWLQYWLLITARVKAKRDAGFPVSAVDYWTNIIAPCVLGSSAIEASWSAVQNTSAFQAKRMPYPIITFVGKKDSKNVGINSNVVRYGLAISICANANPIV